MKKVLKGWLIDNSVTTDNKTDKILLLASAGRSVSFLRIFRQYVVFAGKLLFPDTSSDHVCELFTVFASGTDFLKKEKICADVCQSDADLSAQFLLRDRLSGSNRLVCDRNAA